MYRLRLCGCLATSSLMARSLPLPLPPDASVTHDEIACREPFMVERRGNANTVRQIRRLFFSISPLGRSLLTLLAPTTFPSATGELP